MSAYQWISIIVTVVIAILFIWAILFDKWVEHRTKATYEKYPEMVTYKHNIEQYNNLIKQYDSMIKEQKQAIDHLRIKFTYCGETEEEAKELKMLQKNCRAMCEKDIELLNKRTAEYKERDNFITKHNIRYY